MIGAVLSRNWRFVFPAIAAFVFVFWAEAPFTTDAPILTELDVVEDYEFDRTLVDPLTFSALAERLNGPSVSQGWGPLLPVPIAVEAVDVRAKRLANEIEELVLAGEEQSPISAIQPPTRDRIRQLDYERRD